jgi:2-amino-4-hydroxy-6-hydroxymethyldihydropteridine diphosphokinase
MKVRSVLALGGNLGDRRKTIKSAIRAIKSLEGVTLIAKSPLVESHALTEGGLDESKPNYLNGVVEIETDMKPGDLLDAVRKIEQEHGRIRLERWGSRTLDIDIITYGNLIKSGKRLELPHPRAFQRSFVLVPWALMNPSAVLLGHGKVADLAEPLKHEVWISE